MKYVFASVGQCGWISDQGCETRDGGMPAPLAYAHRGALSFSAESAFSAETGAEPRDGTSPGFPGRPPAAGEGYGAETVSIDDPGYCASMRHVGAVTTVA